MRVRRDVGRRVAELRRAAGLTQDAYAERLNCSVKYVQRVERGDENLTLETMVKLVNGLGVRPVELLKPPRSARPTAMGAPSSAARRRARSAR